MAMTPIEMIEFCDSQVNGGIQRGLEKGKANGGYYLIALNYDEGFKCRLMQTLISWRIGIGNPKEYLIKAIDIANEAISTLSKFETKNILKDFPVDTALIASYLAERPLYVDENLNMNTSGLPFEVILDLEMAKTLRGANNEDAWSSIIDQYKQKKRSALCYNTYCLYKELLFTEDAEKVEPIVRQLEKLFLKRKKNPYYSGGELTEGGGPSNDVTVDYRLGAILKFKSFKGESIHLWRWD